MGSGIQAYHPLNTLNKIYLRTLCIAHTKLWTLLSLRKLMDSQNIEQIIDSASIWISEDMIPL